MTLSSAPAAPIATSAVPEELLAPMSEILFSEEWKELMQIVADFSSESRERRASVEKRLIAKVEDHLKYPSKSSIEEVVAAFLREFVSHCQISSLYAFPKGKDIEERRQKNRLRLDAVMKKFEAVLFPRTQNKSRLEENLETIYRVEGVQEGVRRNVRDWEADFVADKHWREALVQGALELAEFRHPHLSKQMESYSNEIFRFLFSNIVIHGWNNKQLLEVTERIVIRLGTMFESVMQRPFGESRQNNFLYHMMQDVVDSFQPVG